MIKVIIKDIGKHFVWKGMNFYTPVELMINEDEVKSFTATAKVLGITNVKFINPKKKTKKAADVPVQSIAEAVAEAVKSESEAVAESVKAEEAEAEEKEKEEAESDEKKSNKEKKQGKGKKGKGKK
ncbi:MAG: hypothetical protein GXO10_03055 [Crenarchaeota archaeon]|nr:hypothetical protein [Thermoproteota archaeon]